MFYRAEYEKKGASFERVNMHLRLIDWEDSTLFFSIQWDQIHTFSRRVYILIAIISLSLSLLFFLTLVLYLDMILFYNYRTLFILAISRAMINNCTVFIDKSIDNLENLQLLWIS